MRHRHLNHSRFTLAAIDDIIARGQWRHWVDLRTAALRDPFVLDRIERVCARYIRDPRAQRYHFWMRYARESRKPYPQESGESVLHQLQAQLANPLPYDLGELDLSEYRDLAREWLDWDRVKSACGRVAIAIFDRVCEVE